MLEGTLFLAISITQSRISIQYSLKPKQNNIPFFLKPHLQTVIWQCEGDVCVNKCVNSAMRKGVRLDGKRDLHKIKAGQFS